jgi:hypothetical protein
VDDIIDGFIRAGNLLTSGKLPGRNSFALPSANSITVQELAQFWISANGSDVKIDWGAIPYRPTEVIIPREGQPLPGWPPRIALKDGLRSL